MHKLRSYRNLIHDNRLKSFRVKVKETDLLIRASKTLTEVARETTLQYRSVLEKYIERQPDFLHAMLPLPSNGLEPDIIADMLHAAMRAGVGPMASVAGAIAEHVGRALLEFSAEVIVENGGDVFIKTDRAATIGIFANRSPLNLRVGLRFGPQDMPIAVCTSSGTVGHSISYGKADAACVTAASCALADAAATAIGNRVIGKRDIASALNFGKNIKGVKGIVIIKDDKAGLWGDLRTIPLPEKRVEF